MNVRSSLGVLVAGFLCLTVAAQAGTRVALVSTCVSDAGQDLLALAEAQLSQRKDVELVERREVERILTEQKLWSCGASDAGQALAVGKLLGVEVFAALETFPGQKESLGMTVFDASTGVQLSDATLPATDPAKTADAIVTAVVRACAKRRTPIKDLRPVCFLPVRNADLPREMDSLCESVRLLMERRLLGSARVVTLERKQLVAVNTERQVQPDAAASALLPSVLLIELEIGLAPGGQKWQATAYLSDAAGTRVGRVTVTGSPNDAAGLTDRLLAALIKELAVAPDGQVVDRVAEAARFGQEADFLMEHGDIDRAVQAAEAAVAVDPKSAAHRKRLAASLLVQAHNLLQPGLGTTVNGFFQKLEVSTPDLNRSLKFVHRALAVSEVNAQSLYPYLIRLALVRNPGDTETQSLRAELKERYRQVLSDQARLVAKAVTDARAFRIYTQNLTFGWFGELSQVGLPDRAVAEDSATWIEQWLTLIERYPLTENPTSDANRMLAWPTIDANMLLAWPTVWMNFNNAASPDDCALWLPLFEKMEQHPDPIVQTYGQIGRLELELRAGRLPADAAVQRARTIVQRLAEALKGKSIAPGNPVALLYYRAALDALDVLPSSVLDNSTRWRDYGAVLTLMLSRREIANCVVTVTTRDNLWRFDGHPVTPPGRMDKLPKEFLPEVQRNLEAVQKLLDAGDCRLLNVDRKALVTQLEGTRQFLMTEYPELAPARAVPWTTAQRLFVPYENGLEYAANVTLGDGCAYVACLGRTTKGRFLQLVRISLPDGKFQLLGQTPRQGNDVTNRRAVIPTMCGAADRVYVGTCDDGIFVFPVDGRPPEHLSTAEGLPSNWVHSLALYNGRLYAGLGKDEGQFVAYDPVTKSVEVIASSRRKDKRSPFDDGAPFNVTEQRSDPAGQRILLNIATDALRQGVWQYNLPAGTFTRLAETKNVYEWFGPIQSNQILLSPMFPLRTVASFDLSANAVQQIREVPQTAPYLRLGDWLWTGNYFGRVSVDGKVFEYFPDLPKLDHRYGNYDIIGLDALNGGQQVLVTKRSGVWLLSLPEKTAKVLK